MAIHEYTIKPIDKMPDYDCARSQSLLVPLNVLGIWVFVWGIIKRAGEKSSYSLFVIRYWSRQYPITNNE